LLQHASWAHYIEQLQGNRLPVLDVSDPAEVKVVCTAALAVSSPFDFVRTLGEPALPIRFRNNLETAVPYPRKPAAPELRAVGSDHDPDERIGRHRLRSCRTKHRLPEGHDD
jgi:hypothetical protein